MEGLRLFYQMTEVDPRASCTTPRSRDPSVLGSCPARCTSRALTPRRYRANCRTRSGWMTTRSSAVALALVMIACGDDSMLRLGGEDAGKTVAVPLGASVEITLTSGGPGQYGAPQSSSRAV